MNLHLPTLGLDRYKSASPRARVGTEAWGATNFFCPACNSPRLQSAPHGTAAIDYSCPVCDSPFQLKSQSKPFGYKIVDAAYSEMKRAILEDKTPNLYCFALRPRHVGRSDGATRPPFRVRIIRS